MSTDFHPAIPGQSLVHQDYHLVDGAVLCVQLRSHQPITEDDLNGLGIVFGHVAGFVEDYDNARADQ